MYDDYTFIDCDGVILDSEERMLERKYELGFHDHKCEEEFDAFFKYTESNLEEWDEIIRNSKSINNSVEIIRELERIKKKIAILTKIHTLYEMKVKIDVLRNDKKINCPVIFVPPGIKKYQVIVPKGQLLIDDSKKNINGWIENGGTGLIFDRYLEKNDEKSVKSLEFLIKR